MPRGYRLIDHTADVGVQVWGRDAAQLFERAAIALTDLLFITDDLRPDRTQTIEITGLDWADLMVNWLRELLYLSVGQGVGQERVTASVRMDNLAETYLRATLASARFDTGVHRLNHEIKAATYHQIKVEEGPRGWQARVIFDI